MDYRRKLKSLGFAFDGEPANAAEVESLEIALTVRLPEPYRQFLLTVPPAFGNFWIPCAEATPFGYHGIAAFFSIEEVAQHAAALAQNLITIGYGHFDSYTCISIAGADRGDVFAFDGQFRHAWTDDEFYQRFRALDSDIQDYLDLRCRGLLIPKPGGYESLYQIASFDNFIDSLTSDPE